tara:strand:- start:1382 stop:1552 length:171 start_codon:yes stop_codon:yes gene_type:complete
MTDQLLTDEAMKEAQTLYERWGLEYPNHSLADLHCDNVIDLNQYIIMLLYLMEEEE